MSQGSDIPSPSPASTASPQDAAARSRALEVAAVGDLYIGRPIRGERDPDFLAALKHFRQADVRIGNLEFQLLEGDERPAAAAPGAWAGAPSWFADELAWMQVQAVSTANNHAGDYGSDGVASTARALAARGIAQAGTGPHLDEARDAVLVEAPAGRVAMLATSSSHLPHARAGRRRPDAPGRPGVSALRFGTRYRVDGEAYDALQRIAREMPLEEPGGHREQPLQRRYDQERGGEQLSLYGVSFVRGDDFGVESWAADDDAQDIAAAIEAARQRADWVVLQLHSHEYDRRPDEPAAFARQLAHVAIDAGAHAVIGHGAHGVRGIELYRGRPIFHGIGAFIFQPYLFPSQPADFFEAYRLPQAPLAEVYATRRASAGFYEKLDHWEALLVRLSLRPEDAPPAFMVHPVTLWQPGSDIPDGLPRLACNRDGLSLLEKVRRLSAGLGTVLRLDPDRCVLTQPAA